MGFWVGNTPKHLYLYEIHGSDLIIPYGCLKQIAPLIKDAIVESEFKSSVSVDYGDPIPLYSYQENAVRECVSGLYGILQSKAGSGKTQMGIALIREFGKRALWLCHTLDLVKQSKERAERYMDKNLLGLITEGKVNIGSGITFATIQTMSKLDLAQYRDMWDVIIVDECHRVAGTPTAMTQFSKVLNNLSARHKYGLSATVHRSDGMIVATYALLGNVVYTVPDEAIADKVMRVGIKPIGTGVPISRECLNTDGTLNYTKLITYLCNSDFRNDTIQNCIVVESDKSCLILSDRLEHLEILMICLPEWMRDKAVMISGKMTSKKGKAEREQALEDMRTGEKKYLFATYTLCKEGLDIPRLERLFLTTPQKDYAVITQSIGRIARVCEGKADPIVYDFVDNIGYLQKSFKKRCTTYKKNDCYFIGGAE
jgi:superfamily II DNA or RNA helicase